MNNYRVSIKSLVPLIALAAILVLLTSTVSATAGYTEKFETWQATTADTWEVKDLSGYGVPANAVCEVVITNLNANNEYYGGVRANGSSLNRKFLLHEAKQGGWDMVTMFVQANGSSMIDHYSDYLSAVEFILVGYWSSGTYVEKMQSFTAGSSLTWADKSLSGYGVGANQTCEIVMVNKNAGAAKEAGVRTNGSGLARIVDIHKAEAGGVDAATMLVKADANYTIEAYAETDTDIDFYLVGYWTDALGTYTEMFEDMGKPTADGVWEEKNLSGYGVPVGAIAEIILANAADGTENEQGVRKVGSALARKFDVHEAEGGGRDLVRVHVAANASSKIEFYHEDISDAHNFYLTGYWSDTTAPRVVLIHPWGASCADHYHGVNSSVDITVDVTDFTGVDTILANITFPNQTSINLSGFDYGLQSDDFETNSSGLNWSHANSTLAAGQSCYTDINGTHPGKMFIALDGGGGAGPGMHCAYNSIKRANGNYDLNLSFNVTLMENDTFFTLRSAPTDSMSASGLRVYIALIKDSEGDIIYRFAYNNGTATGQENIPTTDTSGKFRIKRSNMTGSPVFNLYYWNNTGGDWIESSFRNISIPGCSRIHFIQIKPGSSASNYGALNVTIDYFQISGDNYKFAIFNQTADIGTYNVTIIANDTLGYVNDTVKSNFTIEDIKYSPSRPYFEEPDVGEFVSGLFNITWGQVSDYENDKVRFNITLLNPDGSYNDTIVSNYGDIDTYYYQWDTNNHSDGLYSMKITVYENETAEGLNNSDTLSGNFTIDNYTPPAISIDEPTEASPVYKKGGELFYVNFTYTEGNPKNYTVTIYNSSDVINSSGGDYPTGGADQVANVSFNFNSTAAEGRYNVLVEMYDNSSNYSISYQNNSVVYVITKGMIAYGDGTNTTPKYRIWDGSAWENELSANDVGGVTNIVVLRSAKTRNEKILGVLDKSGDINVQVWNGTAWGTVLQVTDAVVDFDCRGFDIAYEDSSGDAIIVYQNNTDDPLYMVWNGTDWSGAATLDLPTADIPVWIRMASKPGADEIIVATLDLGADVTAAVWNGSAWGNNISLETAAESSAKNGIAIAYESESGDAMVAWSDGAETSGGPQYIFWNGSAWGTEATAPATSGEPLFIELGSDPSTDRIVMGAMDFGDHVDVNVWNGTAYGMNAEATAGAEKSDLKPADVGFESTSGEAMCPYSENGISTLRYRTWSAGSGWSAESNGPDFGTDIQTGDVRPDPNSDDIMLALVTDDNNLRAAKWSGSAWGTVDILETGVSSTYASFMLSYDRHFIISDVDAGGPYSVGDTISVTWNLAGIASTAEDYINVEYWDVTNGTQFDLTSHATSATSSTSKALTSSEAGHKIAVYVYTASSSGGDNSTAIAQGDPWPDSIVDAVQSWGSYKEEAHTNVWGETGTKYDGTYHVVYMNGEGFLTDHDYKVAYYDKNGWKVQTELNNTSVGTALSSQYDFTSNVSSAFGTWHSVVLNTTGSAPNTYEAAIAHANYTIEDDFEVEQSAIPEFPAVIAAIAVCMLCAVAYIFMRRKVIHGKQER